MAHPLIEALQREREDAAIRGARCRGDLVPASGELALLRQIAADSPLDEPLQAALINALTAAGFRAEALERVENTRRLLREDLGLDLGEDLRSAHRRALAGSDNPRIDSVWMRPAQLPPRVLGFVRRTAIDRVLADHRHEIEAGRLAGIYAITGMGGVGKTALAVDWAHQLARHYPDGQIYLNLRGFDPSGRTLEVGEAVDILLESIGIGLQQAGVSVDARTALFRSSVADRRILLVLDNARDTRQVMPMLPGGSGCLVIVTSRSRLTGLIARHGARQVSLDRLTDAESWDLLSRRLGTRVAADSAAVADLVKACAGLPLALAIVAARAAIDPDESLRSVADDLTAEDRLDALSTGEHDDDVRSTFSWSYAATSADAARIFRLAAAHPGPQITVACLSTIAELTPTRTRQLLVELAAASMITRSSSDRFTVHDLLRAYAAELLDASGERLQAERRLVTHVRHTVRAAYLTYGRQPLNELEPDESVATIPMIDTDEAVDWYVRQRLVVRATAQLAIARGWLRDGIMIILDARPMSMDRDLPSDALPLMAQISEAAEQLGDRPLFAETLRSLGNLYWSDPERSTELIQRAGDIFEAEGDLVGLVNTLRALNMRNAYLGQDQKALEYANAAVEAARRAQRNDLIAVTTSELGTSLVDGGHYAEAIDVLQDAVTLVSEVGVAYMLPILAANLAESWLNLHNWSNAADIARWGLRETRGDASGELMLAAALMRSAWELGDHDGARAAADHFRQLRQSLSDDYVNQVGGLGAETSIVSLASTAAFIDAHLAV